MKKKVFPKFQLGDRVTWTSHANDRVKTKIGKVVFIVKPETIVSRQTVKELVHNYKCQNESRMFLCSDRLHESYLVLVSRFDSNGKRIKPRLYWPVVSKLRKVEATEVIELLTFNFIGQENT